MTPTTSEGHLVIHRSLVIYKQYISLSGQKSPAARFCGTDGKAGGYGVCQLTLDFSSCFLDEVFLVAVNSNVWSELVMVLVIGEDME